MKCALRDGSLAESENFHPLLAEKRKDVPIPIEEMNQRGQISMFYCL